MELAMDQSSVSCDPSTHNPAEPNKDKNNVSGTQKRKNKRLGYSKGSTFLNSLKSKISFTEVNYCKPLE
jgi:hypothetical protein